MTKSIKVLIVDDESDIRSMVSRLLDKTGAITVSVDTLQEAIERSKNELFDYYFVDINLPDGLGTELIPVIKSSTSKAKIFLMSANDTVAKYHEDVNGFLQKPFNRQQILSVVC